MTIFRTKTRKDCRQRFVRYTKMVDHGSYRSEEMLNGLRATKKNHIHVGRGYNQWISKATQVPAGFKETKDYDKKWMEEYQCRDANPYPKKGLDIERWTRKARPAWLTIADIQKLKPGDTLDVLPLDRNVTETVAGSITPNKLHPASVFFKPNRATYEHKGDLKGKLTLLTNSEKIVLDPFEFHVEINKSDNWYPLQDGSLPAKDPQGFVKLLGKKMHWSSMSPSTHVGYRGPMLAASSLKKLPSVFFYRR